MLTDIPSTSHCSTVAEAIQRAIEDEIDGIRDEVDE